MTGTANTSYIPAGDYLPVAQLGDKVQVLGYRRGFVGTIHRIAPDRSWAQVDDGFKIHRFDNYDRVHVFNG